MLKLILLLVLGFFAVIGVAAVGLVALGDSDSDPESGAQSQATPAGPRPTAEGPLTAEDVLEQSAQRSAEVTSFHFILTHENGSTPLPLNLDLESAEGDVVVPDQLKAAVDAEAVGINVSVDVVGIGDRTWVTNPFTRGWEELPGTNIRDFADPAALVSGLLPAITDPQLTEGDSVDGVETHLVTGSIDSGALQDALGIAEPGQTVEVEAWIGVDDLLPRRVRLIGPLSTADSADVVRQVELSRFDEPVEIMPPE
jgi:hypothetical protein